MTSKEDHCQMAERIIKLESKQDYINEELRENRESIKENTKAIQQLCKTIIEHQSILQNQQQKGNNFYAIITGVSVGIVMLIVNAIIRIM